MNHDDVVQAAFRVWGREAYRKMSLTDVAAELGVTKPALYRHFRDKDELLEAMRASFFDRLAESMLSAFPEGLAGLHDSSAATLRMVEELAIFFGASPGDLAFMFARVLRLPGFDRVFSAELAARGVRSGQKPAAGNAGTVRAHMAIGSCFFMVASFHLQRREEGLAQPPSPVELSALVSSALGLAERGLGQAAVSGAEPVDYEALEAKARLSEAETDAPDGLLPAAAAVVAQVGSWNASMEMVAKRSGLSKSGLYSHFRSKEDMLMRLFESEFERIASSLAVRLEDRDGGSERLYLAIATAAGYLVARPDILVALDWLRMQRLGEPGQLPPRLLELFSFLGDEGSGLSLVRGSLGLTVRWIMFMTVHLLMRCGGADSATRLRNLRMLHGFLLGGLRFVPSVAPWADLI